MSPGEVEGKRKKRSGVLDDSLKFPGGDQHSGPQALTILAPCTGDSAAGGEGLMAPVGAVSRHCSDGSLCPGWGWGGGR